MATTVTNLATATTTSAAASHTSASFTPTGDAWIVVFFQSWLTGAGTIAHAVSDSETLTWSKAAGRGDESSVTTAFGGTDSRCTLWTAKAAASPPSMTVAMESHASVTAEAGWTIVELTGDVDGTDPFVEAIATIVGNSGTDASGGITETTGTLAVSPSNKVIAGFGFEHNTQGAPDPTWDTEPTDWSAVSGTTIEPDQWWLQELIETTTTKTSATHGITGDTLLQNRAMFIAEIDEAGGAASLLLPNTSARRSHFLTR